MSNKIKIKAGVFVVALLFLATTVTVNAVDPQQPSSANPEQAQQYIYFEEEPDFPDEMPEGTSSLTLITKRRVIDVWHGIIYDVGFSIWVMKLKNGPEHFWDFDGQIEIVPQEGEEPEIIPKEFYASWDGYVFPGFVIHRVASVILPDHFYTAHLTATITKDMGPPELEDVMLEGYYYHVGDVYAKVEQTQTLPMEQ